MTSRNASLGSTPAWRTALWACAVLAVGAAAILALPSAQAQPPPTPPPAPAPSNCNYSINNAAAYNWDEIAPPAGGSGTGLDFDDYSTEWVTPTPSFAFNFCGAYYWDFFLISKGYLCFGDGTTTPSNCGCCPYSPSSSLTSTSVGRPAVMGYYSDIYPGGCPPNFSGLDCVYWQVLGTPPNRRLVFEFRQVPWWPNNGPGPLTFEIKLFEATHCVEAHYQSVSGSNGSSLVIGYQDAAGTAGWQYTYSAGSGHTTANSAWSACPAVPPPPPPPRCAPNSQTVPINQAATLTASGSATGSYSWSAPGGTPASGTGVPFVVAYPTPGTYSVTVSDANGGTTCKVVVTPPPGCGYTVTTGPGVFDWVELAPAAGGSGTPMTGFFDYTMANVPSGPAPFPFQFCGVTYTHTFPVSKGQVCFSTSAANPPNCRTCCPYSPPSNVPSTSVNRPAVYGLYADIYPGGCSGGSAACMFWKVEGSPPNRVLVYEWRQVPYYSCCYPGPLTFEIKLFENSNCIEVHYLSATGGSGYNKLAGYQDAAGTAAWTYLYGSSAISQVGTAWRACPFGASADAVTFNEDQPAQSFNVTANDNGAGSPLTIIAHTNPAKGALTVPASGPDGVVTYEPFDDAVGADSFEYTIEGEPGMTATGHVEITINPVNDAPRFTAGPDVEWAPTHGAYAGTGWATAVAAGPAGALDEAGQAVEFDLVSVSNPGLFASLPTLERTATADMATPLDPPVSGAFAVLRFEPSGGSGLSVVCFAARDDGGTDTVTTVGLAPPRSDTGIDASAPQCATVALNGPPMAYFEVGSGEAQPGQALSFDACPGPAPYRCSHDLDGTIVSYAWDFGDGATSATPTPVHAFAGPGRYAVRLTVTDDSRLTATTLRSVAIGWPSGAGVDEAASGAPAAPIADAGPDLEARQGDPVALAGAARGASDHATYLWSQAGGPAVQIADPTSATLRFEAPAAAAGQPVQLAFSLRVFDGALASAPDHVTVTVRSLNHAPRASAGGPVVAVAGGPVALDAGGSVDPDGDPLTFRWEQTDGPAVSLVGADRETATFTAPAAPGQLTFRLEASDGQATGLGTVVVHVQPVEAAPLEARMEVEVVPDAAGAQVAFTAVGAADAAWDFGDGSPGAAGARVTHRYAAGDYEARMTVGSTTYAQRIHVEPAAPTGPQALAGPSPLVWVGIAAAFAAAAILAVAVVQRGRKQK